jgi:hypothetical protein
VKTLRITLDIDLEPLSAEELAASGVDQLPEDCRPTGTDEDLEEVTADEFADMIAGHLPESNSELWAGTNLYAKITQIRVVS